MSGLLFTNAHKLVRARILTVLERHNLSPTYWAILGATAQAPEGIRQSHIAAMLTVKAPVITTEAVELINRDLIRRIPHHTDGRAKLLVITPKGKKLANTIENELNEEIHKLLNGLTGEEVLIFQKTLETIIHNSK